MYTSDKSSISPLIKKGARSALYAVAAMALLGGCIKNDIPYPHIPVAIRKLACQGEESPAMIDSVNSTVTLRLLEDTDIQKIKFTECKISENATMSPDLNEGTYDLTDPMVVTLSLYQDYQWVIKAEQNIERYFEIEGQIGASTIDPVGHRVIVKIPSTANLATLTLLQAKLGPAGITTMSPSLTPGPINLSRPLDVDVTYHGRTEVWTIYAERTTLLVSTTSVDAWSRILWLYGSGPADVQNTFEYKADGDEEWTKLPLEEITQQSGNFSACISHLEPLTKYSVRAISGENEGNIITVTTQSTEELPDGDFDEWNKVGAVWYPYPEGGPQFWDTGNKGAATLGESNVTPSDHVPAGQTGKSAKLETKFIGVGPFGKLGAGSIYTGTYVKTDVTNGILDFGRPWTLRPTYLRGYYQYTTAPINYTSTEYKALEGRPDTCHIYIALTDWTAPFEIRTNPKNRQLFDPNSSAVIGYGELIRGSNTNGYEPFEIEVKYRSTSRIPRYIQITAAASKYGDFFTGGTGATLYVDNFTLDYDLPQESNKGKGIVNKKKGIR